MQIGVVVVVVVWLVCLDVWVSWGFFLVCLKGEEMLIAYEVLKVGCSRNLQDSD